MKKRSRRYHRRRDAFKWAKKEMKKLTAPRRLLKQFVDMRMEKTRSLKS